MVHRMMRHVLLTTRPLSTTSPDVGCRAVVFNTADALVVIPLGCPSAVVFSAPTSLIFSLAVGLDAHALPAMIRRSLPKKGCSALESLDSLTN